MMKKMRKILSFVVVFIFVFSAIPSFFAVAQETNDEQSLENVWEILETAEAAAIAQGLCRKPLHIMRYTTK